MENLVRKEITEADPIGLISMGAPKDEYDTEVKEIIARIDTCKSTTDLQELIYGIFVKMFDEKIAGRRETYQNLAGRIFSSLKTNSTWTH